MPRHDDHTNSKWWAEYATYHSPRLTVGEHHAQGGVTIPYEADLDPHDPADVAGAFAKLPDNWTMIGEIQEIDPNFFVAQVIPTDNTPPTR